MEKYINNFTSTSINNYNSISNQFNLYDELLNISDKYNFDYLEKYFKIYSDVFNKTNNNNIEIIKIDNKQDIKNIKNTLLNYYKRIIDDNINEKYDFYQELEKVDKYYECKIMEDGYNYTLYILDNNKEYCEKLCFIFCVFINYIKLNKTYFDNFNKKIFRYMNNQTFPIYLFPNNLERKVNDVKYNCDNYKITNGAFTTSGVTVYGIHSINTKREELAKLLIHEMSHLYHIEGSYNHENTLDDIKKNMPFQDDNTDSECLAELLAVIFNCMNNSLFLEKEYQKSFELFKKMLIIELNYSCYICNKILKYFNINNKELFNYKKEKISIISPINLYYFLKTIIFINFNFLINNTLKDNMLIFNKKIFKKISQIIKMSQNTFINILNKYNSDLKENKHMSYICLDLDLKKIELKKDNQKGGYFNSKINSKYYKKYIKYKNKYLAIKLKR
jgi:hypothetical protein